MGRCPAQATRTFALARDSLSGSQSDPNHPVVAPCGLTAAPRTDVSARPPEHPATGRSEPNC